MYVAKLISIILMHCHCIVNITIITYNVNTNQFRSFADPYKDVKDVSAIQATGKSKVIQKKPEASSKADKT